MRPCLKRIQPMPNVPLAYVSVYQRMSDIFHTLANTSTICNSVTGHSRKRISWGKMIIFIYLMSITRGVVAQFTREKLANLRIKFLPSTYRRHEKRNGWQQVYRREIKEYKIVYNYRLWTHAKSAGVLWRYWWEPSPWTPPLWNTWRLWKQKHLYMGNSLVSSAIWKKHAWVSFSKTIKIERV